MGNRLVEEASYEPSIEPGSLALMRIPPAPDGTSNRPRLSFRRLSGNSPSVQLCRNHKSARFCIALVTAQVGSGRRLRAILSARSAKRVRVCWDGRVDASGRRGGGASDGGVERADGEGPNGQCGTRSDGSLGLSMFLTSSSNWVSRLSSLSCSVRSCSSASLSAA